MLKVLVVGLTTNKKCAKLYLHATGIVLVSSSLLAIRSSGGAFGLGMKAKKGAEFPRPFFVYRNISAIIQNLFPFCIIAYQQLTAHCGFVPLQCTLQNDRFVELRVSPFLETR